jgi:arylsulfatase I/J
MFVAILALVGASSHTPFAFGPDHNGGFEELPHRTAAKKPHILFVLWDDYGWTGAGYHPQTNSSGPAEIRTPSLNRLVGEGIEMDRSYVFYCCSPTRSSIQSGRNPIHVNVLNADPAIWNSSNPDSAGAGIARNMTTMATKMVAGGYRTHFVGKWDCGMATNEHTPRGRGYHSSLGYFHHANNYWTMKDTGSCNGTEMVDLWVAEVSRLLIDC